MSDNQRKYQRHEVHVDVELSFDDNPPATVRTRDISEGGMFLELPNSAEYPLGEMVHLKYKDPTHDDLDTDIDAIIVRIAEDGLGIAFVELDAF